jgi:hypothetical protein
VCFLLFEALPFSLSLLNQMSTDHATQKANDLHAMLRASAAAVTTQTKADAEAKRHMPPPKASLLGVPTATANKAPSPPASMDVSAPQNGEAAVVPPPKKAADLKPSDAAAASTSEEVKSKKKSESKVTERHTKPDGTQHEVEIERNGKPVPPTGAAAAAATATATAPVPDPTGQTDRDGDTKMDTEVPTKTNEKPKSSAKAKDDDEEEGEGEVEPMRRPRAFSVADDAADDADIDQKDPPKKRELREKKTAVAAPVAAASGGGGGGGGGSEEPVAEKKKKKTETPVSSRTEALIKAANNHLKHGLSDLILFQEHLTVVKGVDLHKVSQHAFPRAGSKLYIIKGGLYASLSSVLVRGSKCFKSDDKGSVASFVLACRFRHVPAASDEEDTAYTVASLMAHIGDELDDNDKTRSDVHPLYKFGENLLVNVQEIYARIMTNLQNGFDFKNDSKIDAHMCPFGSTASEAMDVTSTSVMTGLSPVRKFIGKIMIMLMQPVRLRVCGGLDTSPDVDTSSGDSIISSYVKRVYELVTQTGKKSDAPDPSKGLGGDDAVAAAAPSDDESAAKAKTKANGKPKPKPKAKPKSEPEPDESESEPARPAKTKVKPAASASAPDKPGKATTAADNEEKKKQKKKRKPKDEEEDEDGDDGADAEEEEAEKKPPPKKKLKKLSETDADETETESSSAESKAKGKPKPKANPAPALKPKPKPKPAECDDDGDANMEPVPSKPAAKAKAKAKPSSDQEMMERALRAVAESAEDEDGDDGDKGIAASLTKKTENPKKKVTAAAAADEDDE